jgi:hypothetical protein
MPGNDSYTKLLLHFDETDAAFADSSVGGVHGLGVNTDLVYSAEGHFSGCANFILNPAANLGFSASSDWDLGTGDWTIDFWVKIQSTGVQMICGNVNTDPFWSFIYINPGGSQVVVQTSDGFICYTDNFVWDLPSTWQHIAVVHTAATFYIFNNGQPTILTANSPEYAFGANQTFNFGWQVGEQFYGLQSYIDEFRLSKGIARWTANFTPPTDPYSSTRTKFPIVARPQYGL